MLQGKECYVLKRTTPADLFRFIMSKTNLFTLCGFPLFNFFLVYCRADICYFINIIDGCVIYTGDMFGV